MRLRQAIPAISAMFVAGVIAACGGGTSDNGEASKSPDAIVSDATAAMGSLHTVHVAGTTATAGPPTTLDVHLVNGQGGRGQVSQSGLSFNVIALDQSVYLNAQPSGGTSRRGGPSPCRRARRRTAGHGGRARGACPWWWCWARSLTVDPRPTLVQQVGPRIRSLSLRLLLEPASTAVVAPACL